METTGLNFYHDKIIEIGAIDNHGNTFEVLINPHCELREVKPIKRVCKTASTPSP